ncbi:hypothetical protein Tco_1141176 [Tanacetum coccineum]
MLHRDRRAHAYISRLMESKARLSREAWVQSMDTSDTTRSETQMAVLQSQQTPARDPAHPDVPEEAENGTKKNHHINTSHNNHPTTSVTDEQLKRLIDQGVADALAVREATRSRNGKDSHDSGMGVRRQAPFTHEMEIVFRISNYSMENQIKFSTCTLLGSALTWWNSHIKTIGYDVAYAMTWTNLKKKMIDKYCPRGEVKKLEGEMMFPEESEKIEKYVGGLPDMIQGSVMASKPKIMQDAIEFATEMMDKKIHTFAK